MEIWVRAIAMDYTNITSLIEAHRKNLNFGNESAAPSEERIDKTEARLGVPLPESYKWFLRHYGGGEVNGDEISSIYQNDDESLPSGDLVYQYLINRRSGYIESHQIPLMSTDFGEFFFLGASVKREENEYPVYIKRGDNAQLFAGHFIEFLTKIINQNFD